MRPRALNCTSQPGAAHTPLGVGDGGGDEATVRRPARRYVSPYRSQVAAWPPNGSLYATHMVAPPALSIEHRHLARSASFAAVDTIARTPSTSTTSTRLCALQDDVLPCLSGVIKRMLSLFRRTSQSLRRRPADAPYAARRPEARTTPPD